MILSARSHEIVFPRRPLIMGIININSDSFSGDGTMDLEQALKRGNDLVSAGADLIDVGGESARTNREPISESEEIDRVAPFIRRFPETYSQVDPVDHEQIFPPLLSINTWRPAVTEHLLVEGGDILNDMSALSTSDNARLAARFGAALLIMHSIGLPKQKHTHIFYQDVCQTIFDFFATKIDQATAAGLARESIILDPGLDFAKQRDDNLRILAGLDLFRAFKRPLLLPVSRKTVIGEVLNLENPQDRDAGTVACVVAATLRGASIFRVHNVHAITQTLRTIWPVVRGA